MTANMSLLMIGTHRCECYSFDWQFNHMVVDERVLLEATHS